MTAVRPRLSVVLDEEVVDTLRRVAAVRGMSMSAVAGEVLTEFVPAMKQVAQLGEAMERLSNAQREKMREAIARAEQNVTGPLTATAEGAAEVFAAFEAAVVEGSASGDLGTGLTPPR